MKLTQKELAELIAKVFASISQKRREAGGDMGDVSIDEIIAEISALIGDLDGEGDTGDGGEAAKGDGGDGDENAVSALVAQVLAALEANGAKAGTGAGEQKAASAAAATGAAPTATAAPAAPAASPATAAAPAAPAAAPQRKYADIFLSRSGSRDGAAGSSFKERMASMPVPERRKTAYGMFGRAVKCIHTSGGDVERAAHTAEHKFQDTEMAREFKALSATVPSDGGYLVPEVYADEIIELLYPSTVIYSLGARRLGMPNGNMNIPKLKTGARAMFVGENRKISKSEPKFGNLKLSAKKLSAIIPMSNDLLRSTNFDNDVIVGQDVTMQMALGVDYGALMGSGTEFQPLGITRNKGVLNVDVTALGEGYAGKDGALTAAFPNYLVAAVLKNNVYAAGLGFAFNTSVEQYFKSLRDNVGGFIFAEEMSKNGTLAGYPYKTTNQIETRDGKTCIIFGNWNDLVIGEQGAMEIETSREGSWTDDAGNLVSAFENDQTIIRAVNNVDVGLRHEESFAVATKVAVPV